MRLNLRATVCLSVSWSVGWSAIQSSLPMLHSSISQPHDTHTHTHTHTHIAVSCDHPSHAQFNGSLWDDNAILDCLRYELFIIARLHEIYHEIDDDEVAQQSADDDDAIVLLSKWSPGSSISAATCTYKACLLKNNASFNPTVVISRRDKQNTDLLTDVVINKSNIYFIVWDLISFALSLISSCVVILYLDILLRIPRSVLFNMTVYYSLRYPE